MKNKKVIYTCITGDYDELLNHSFVNLGWDYVCFTDNLKISNNKNSQWKIRKIEFKDLDDVRNQRWHKINPHLLFPEYEESLWVDANINIISSGVFDDIENVKKNGAKISIPKHPERDCIYDEVEACVLLGKDDEKIIRKQVSIIREDNFPKHVGLFETNIIYRKHGDSNVIKNMEDWWYWVSNYSRRDQLSLNYVLWKNNFPVPFLNNQTYRNLKLNRVVFNFAKNHITKEELIVLNEKFKKQAFLLEEKIEFLNKKNKEIENLESVLCFLNKEINFLKKEVEAKNFLIYNIFNSKSWRITKPVRILASCLKKIFKKLRYFFKKIASYFFSVKILNGLYLDKNKKNIAFVLNTFDKGGVEEIVYALSTGLCNKFNIIIFLSGNKIGHIGSLIKNRNINLIVLKNNEYLLSRILNRLELRLVNFHYELFGFNLFKDRKIKTLYTVHNNYIWSNEQLIEERGQIYKEIDSFVAVSSQVKDYFSKKFNVNENKISVICNGLNPNVINSRTIEKREDFFLKKEDFVFINVASFTVNKFHILMVLAMRVIAKKYPNVKILFVGNILDIEYYKYIKEKINEFNLENNIFIINYLPKNRIFGLLNISNVFVLPSLTEGWGISTTEAMLSGLPVIVSDVGGARDLIKDNDVGIVIKRPYKNILDLNNEIISRDFVKDGSFDNLDELCQAMEEIYLNYDKWADNAKIGSLRIKNNFSEEKMVLEYLNKINELDKNEK